MLAHLRRCHRDEAKRRAAISSLKDNEEAKEKFQLLLKLVKDYSLGEVAEGT